MATSHNHTEQLLGQFDRLAYLGALVLIILLVGLYFWVAAFNPSANSALEYAQKLALGLIPNLIPILLLFVLSYALFRKIQQIKSEQETDSLANKISSEVNKSLLAGHITGDEDVKFYDEFGQVPWSKLLSTCSTLDICVHYFDTWITGDTHRLLSQLFDRGGVVRIILPNFANQPLVALINQRFPEYPEDMLRSKIENTQKKLSIILKESSNKNARLETYFVDDMIFYCGLRFDRRILVLSFCEHIRKMRIDSPAVAIMLSKRSDTQRWFEKEFVGLMDKAVSKHNLSGRDLI